MSHTDDDGESIPACPACGSGIISGPREIDSEPNTCRYNPESLFTCYRCQAGFDEPVERETYPHGRGTETKEHSKARKTLLENARERTESLLDAPEPDDRRL